MSVIQLICNDQCLNKVEYYSIPCSFRYVKVHIYPFLLPTLQKEKKKSREYTIKIRQNHVDVRVTKHTGHTAITNITRRFANSTGPCVL